LRRREAQVQVRGAARAAEDESETATVVDADGCGHVDGEVRRADALQTCGGRGGIVCGSGHRQDVGKDQTGGIAERRRHADVAALCSARSVSMGATRMMLPTSSRPSPLDLRMMSSAWSQGTLRSLMVTEPFTSSATMMFFLLISAMAPSRFLMSMSLTLKSTFRPL